MKNKYLKNTKLLFLGFAIFFISNLNAQDKQYKARLSVDYVHIIGANPYLEVASKFKGENGYEPSTMLDLNVYYKLSEDSIVFVGKIKTNHKGIGRYELQKASGNNVDSLVSYTYLVKIEGNNKFKNAKKSVTFYKANLIAEIVELDSLKTIKATLVDESGEPISNQKLKIYLDRMFAPLGIGKSYKTDKEGNISVPLLGQYSGVDGKLDFEVLLDSKKYGTVKYRLTASIGEPVKDISTFDQRTMWSPPSKTPMFLLIFPNLLLLGIWCVILLIIINLYKIYST